ncbi:hypothetical protein DPMN_067953 [Dreissena polymorpha]|uniref:Uncharacterized protein n=1 Tax=Dreissena polymorpha TaxID=45954 RepID=A0A9D3Z0N3_DREPO|nr:hypothetical protein DPMN_067953 [Dreissena polymorpha]
MTEVQCLGLYYLKLTGPYWNLVVNNKVPYVQLYKDVQIIHSYLKELEVNPANLLQDVPLREKDALKVPYHDLLKQKLERISEESKYRELFHEMVKMTSKAMKRTVEKQLSDFLDGGKFGQEPEEKQLDRTSFAPLTNLTCEHHFGHLDRSQRKRPGASLHHHTSVQLLKQSRTPMMKWIEEIPESDKTKLLKSARLGGKTMRKKTSTTRSQGSI